MFWCRIKSCQTIYNLPLRARVGSFSLKLNDKSKKKTWKTKYISQSKLRGIRVYNYLYTSGIVVFAPILDLKVSYHVPQVYILYFYIYVGMSNIIGFSRVVSAPKIHCDAKFNFRNSPTWRSREFIIQCECKRTWATCLSRSIQRCIRFAVTHQPFLIYSTVYIRILINNRIYYAETFSSASS